MRLETVHRGGERPFEGERQLVLRGLPANALVQRATATIAPTNGARAGQFVESIGFAGEQGEWGATATIQGAAVEVAFHARRTLAAVSGPSVANSPLLVDLGGGYVPVGATGAFTTTGPAFTVPADGSLPGLTVAGFRLATASGVTEVRVRSVPSNVALGLAGGPPLFAMVGDLVGAVTTPDFTRLLTDFLTGAEVRHGAFVVPFVVRSDTIARLDVTLTVDYLELADVEPPSVDRVSLAYQYGTEPQSAPSVAVSLPAGTAAVPGATAGRVQGAFDSSRVVAGEKGATEVVARVAVTAGSPQAQPLVLDATTLATSVDVHVAAVSASARVKLDVLEDLDGKPGGRSLLPKASSFRLTRDDAPDLTWVNVALPAELEFPTGARHWVALLVEEGEVTWGAGSAAAVPGLHQTADGGLSWRPTPHPAGGVALAANLRLRHTPGAFTMPVELHVGNAHAPQRVGLERFAPERRVDLDLDFPEFAVAINDALATDAGSQCSPAEHLGNGDFAAWLRLGDQVGTPIFEDDAITLQGFPSCIELSGDGRRAFAVTRGDVPRGRVYVIDTVCRSIVAEIQVRDDDPTAFAVTADGRLGVLAIRSSAGDGSAVGAFQLVDLEAGRLTGAPVPFPAVVTALAVAPDGDTVYAGHDDPTLGGRVEALSLAELETAARSGAAMVAGDRRSAMLTERPIRIAPAGDGRVFVLGSSETGNSRVHVLAAGFRDDDDPIATVGDLPTPRDLALSGDGSTVLAVAAELLLFVDTATLSATPITAEATPSAAVFEPSGAALVASDQGLLRRRPRSGTLARTGAGTAFSTMRLSPQGDQLVALDPEADEVSFVRIGVPAPVDWELTAGTVQPICFGTPRGPAALLGTISQDGTAAQPPFPSAVSQIVPVGAGCTYRFTLDAVAQFEGAVAEVHWIGDQCATLAGKPVAVPIAVAPEDGEVTLVRHDVTATAPAGAVRAEVRIATAAGAAVVTGVSLRGSGAAVANPSFRVERQSVPGWTPTGQATVAVGAGGTLVRNDGTADARLEQEADIGDDQRFTLRADARLAGRGGTAGRLELGFAAADGGTVGEPITLDISEDAFPDAVVRGPVPDGAAIAKATVVVPPRSAVELRSVDLAFDSPRSVPLTFVADAPGELAVTGLRVPYVESPAPPPAPPPGDPCRPTPPGACEDEVKPGTCFCRSCQAHQRIRQPAAAVIAADRVVTVAECAACGTPVTGVIGSERDHRHRVEAVVIDTRPASTARPAAEVHEVVPLPAVVAVRGIGPHFAAELASLSISNVRDLSLAQPAEVATIRGISLAGAERFVTAARELTVAATRARRRSIFR